MRIAIDIDGTLRDLETQIRRYIEEDYPEKLDEYDKIIGIEYRTMNPLIGADEAMNWFYEERPFELFAMAPRLHRTLIEDLNKFAATAEVQGHSVEIASVQRGKSIIATLHWLSKMGCKIKKYSFYDTMQDKIDAKFDVYLDDCPQVLEACKPGFELIYDTTLPLAIKVPYEFNKHIGCPSLDVVNGKFNDIYDILNIERGF